MFRQQIRLLELKKEYSDLLKKIMVPVIYSGIIQMFDSAQEMYNDLNKNNSSSNHTVLTIFHLCLDSLSKLEKNTIIEEINKMKTQNNCSEWFELLVKSTIKSHYLFLANLKKSIVYDKTVYENVDIVDFVHKIYVECSKIIKLFSEFLLVKKNNFMQIKKKQHKIYKLIESSIDFVIKNSLPLKLILNEYVNNDDQYDSEIVDDENRKSIFVNKHKNQLNYAEQSQQHITPYDKKIDQDRQTNTTMKSKFTQEKSAQSNSANTNKLTQTKSANDNKLTQTKSVNNDDVKVELKKDNDEIKQVKLSEKEQSATEHYSDVNKKNEDEQNMQKKIDKIESLV